MSEKFVGPENTLKIKIIWSLLKPYWLPIIIIFILSILQGLLEMLSVATVAPILALGLNIEAKQHNPVLSLIDKVANLFPADDIFIGYCILFILISIAAAIVKLIVVYLSSLIVARMVVKIKHSIFRKYMEADYQYFIDHKQGELIYNISQASLSIQPLMTAVATLLSESLLILFIFSFLFLESWLIALIGIGLVIIYYLITRYLGTKISYLTGKGRVEAGTEEEISANEAINGIRQIKVFNTYHNWLEKFNNAVNRYWEYYRRDTVWAQSLPIILMLFIYSIIGIAALILKVQSPSGFMKSVPTFGVFGFSLLRLLPSISKFGMLRMQIMSSLPNCELTYSIINEKVNKIQDGEKELATLSSNIALEKVSFSHKGREGTINDASIVFEKGKVTALVGPSGAGKTTIIDLLLRLFDPDEGKVTIDGINLREYKQSTWLNKLGFVSQDTFIFHDTIRNNIAFISDKYSNEDIVRAAINANAHEFINALPQGYDTVVGDRGTRLSGGQRQRIAIARAMIREPEILILDEATSALDNVSEALVQDAIDRISSDRTVIVVAHRLSTIINADKIVVLSQGRVMDEGTHRELMEKRGIYYNLYKQGNNI